MPEVNGDIMQIQNLQAVWQRSGVRLDPRTKIAILLIVNIPAFTVDVWYILALAAAIPLSLLALSKQYRTAVLCSGLYAVALLGDTFLVDTTHGALNIIITMVSGMLCRMMPGLIMGYFLLSTTMVSEFVAAMERMGIPKQVIIPFSVMFRFFPTVYEEHSAIGDAMRMRGIRFGNTRGGPLALMEYRLVPLFISCVKIGEELSSAALTRGLGSPVKRTNICKIGFHRQDIFYLAIALVVLLLFMMR